METINDDPNRILLQAGMAVLLIALALAWTLVFTRAIPIDIVTNVIADYPRLLQAHIDFLLMGALLLGFYGARVPLPKSVRGAMAIGVFTNPAGFLYLALWPELITDAFLAFSVVSFVITTYGFGMACVVILRSTVSRRAESFAAGRAAATSGA